MMDNILVVIHAAFLLLFGIFLSAAFAGIKINRKTGMVLFAFCAASGAVQAVLFVLFSEEFVWKMYPFVSHFPFFSLLVIGYKRKISTAIVSICTVYMCCQPAKCIGLMAKNIFGNSAVEYTVRIIAITLVFGFVFFKLSDYIAEIFTKDEKTVYIFGITPIFYYIFDYISAVYTDYRFFKIQGGVEFLALFLCVAFLVFCFVYHKEYEKKADVKRKEQIIRITVEEQKKGT